MEKQADKMVAVFVSDGFDAALLYADKVSPVWIETKQSLVLKFNDGSRVAITDTEMEVF
jgi:hypothetical protein